MFRKKQLHYSAHLWSSLNPSPQLSLSFHVIHGLSDEVTEIHESFLLCSKAYLLVFRNKSLLDTELMLCSISF